MRKIVLVSIALLGASVANAVPYTVTNTADNIVDPPTASWFLPAGTDPAYMPPWYRYGHQDWGWDHAVTYLPDPCPYGDGIFTFVSGSLEVHAWGVTDEDPTLVYGDGVLLGPLQPQPPGWGNAWTTTILNLSPAFLQSYLADGDLDIWMNIDTLWSGSGVILDRALLTVNYQWECAPVVPAPGGVVLVGIGAGLLGWLRRRRYA